MKKKHGETRSARGFASMDAHKQRAIASKGGKAVHAKGVAHEWTSEQARAAGQRGGVAVAKREGHMAAIGRKGGAKVGGDSEHMAEIGRKGGERVSRDREYMAVIGRKGAVASAEVRRRRKTDGGAP